MSFVKKTGEPGLSFGGCAGLEPLFEDWLGSARNNEGANNETAVIFNPAARNFRRLGIAESADVFGLFFPSLRFCILVALMVSP
jgi:hypothetical protein